jgi:hypothetical protein
LIHAIEVTLECVDVGRPEAAERSEPGVYLHEWRGPYTVETPLRINARLHKAGLTQYPQVFGDRGLRQSQLLLDIADGSLRGREQTQDGAAARLGNDGKW